MAGQQRLVHLGEHVNRTVDNGRVVRQAGLTADALEDLMNCGRFT
jgi:hypothetical protein